MRFLWLLTLLVFTDAAPVRADPANYAVVLTIARTDPVWGVDSDGNAIQAGSILRSVGYVANIIVWDPIASPLWTVAPGTEVVPQGVLQIGDVTTP